MRLSNFANVDPVQQDRGIIGLTGGKNKVEPIWNEFANSRELLEKEINRIKRNQLRKK